MNEYTDYRFPIAGRFRSGRRIDGQDERLATWRITTSTAQVAERVSELYGGSPNVWDPAASEPFEVVTATDAVRIHTIYSHAQMATSSTGEQPKPETLVVFLLVDAPELGVWRHYSHSHTVRLRIDSMPTPHVRCVLSLDAIKVKNREPFPAPNLRLIEPAPDPRVTYADHLVPATEVA